MNIEKEKVAERETLHFGTVKRKADLLNDIDVSPNKLNWAMKKFNVPVPEWLHEVDGYTSDLFDFLLDYDGDYYEKLPESKLMERLSGYVLNAIWINKQKKRNILVNECAVAMDMRKCLKDHASKEAQMIGHAVKHSGKELTASEAKKFRADLQLIVDETISERFGKLLSETRLLD